MRTLLGCLVLVCALLTGCGISKSISNSISTSGESISDSISSLSPSGGDSSKATYERDVTAYAAVFAGSPGTGREFLRGLGQVAERHGITHWEAEPETLRLAGTGLRRGGLSAERLTDLSDRIAESDPESARRLVEGYESAR